MLSFVYRAACLPAALLVLLGVACLCPAARADKALSGSPASTSTESANEGTSEGTSETAGENPAEKARPAKGAIIKATPQATYAAQLRSNQALIKLMQSPASSVDLRSVGDLIILYRRKITDNPHDSNLRLKLVVISILSEIWKVPRPK